nr:MAG TPA: Recombination enhancement, RecA-dependent nuclease [Caudoviricetes sp.]
MTNEYGAPLDRNGYAPSIVQADTDERCWLCGGGAWDGLERHEIFGGRGRREKSKRLGLWLTLCRRCHQASPMAAHQNANTMALLHQVGQKAAMQHYGWDTNRFISEFGRNYITEDEK